MSDSNELMLRPGDQSRSYLLVLKGDERSRMAMQIANTCVRRDVNGHVRSLHKDLPVDVRAELTERNRRLRAILAEQNTGRAARAISDMLGAYRNAIKPGEDPVRVTQKYVEDLCDVPVWAIELACGAIKLNRADGVSIDHPPSTIRVREVAERHTKPAREEASMISAILLAPADRAAPDPTPEERARVKSGFVELGGKLRTAAEIARREMRDAERAKSAAYAREVNEMIGRQVVPE